MRREARTADAKPPLQPGRTTLNLIRRLFPRSLEEAAATGRLAAVRRYLRHNPQQGAKDKGVLVAIKARHLNIARVLFEHKANINARDNNGDTALHFACDWPPQYDAVHWLVENGADVNACNYDGITPETGHRPLFDAASSYDYRLAAFLLNAGADPNALSPDGSALHRASSSGFKYTPETFQHYGGNIVSLLLERGAEPNLREQFEGKTPLHSATDLSYPARSVKDRYLAIVTLLLEHGADPTIKDNLGMTPLDYAEKNHHTEAEDVLRQASS